MSSNPASTNRGEDAAASSWPTGGLPHGEHPHDYGYDGEAEGMSAREYEANIWNLPETPEMFHRQAPGANL